VGEALHPVQLDGSAALDQMREHPAPPDGRELQGVTDEGHSPPPALGQMSQFSQAGGGHHGRLVDDDGGPHRQVEAVVGWALEAVLDQELVESVGIDTGAHGQDLRCGC
jgi:hypothetical protein